MNQDEKKRVDILEIRMSELEEQQKLTNENLTRVLFFMDNDNATGSKGIVEKLDTVERKVDQLLQREEIYLTKVKTLSGIVGLIMGIVGSLAFAAIKKLLNI